MVKIFPNKPWKFHHPDLLDFFVGFPPCLLWGCKIPNTIFAALIMYIIYILLYQCLLSDLLFQETHGEFWKRHRLTFIPLLETGDGTLGEIVISWPSGPNLRLKSLQIDRHVETEIFFKEPENLLFLFICSLLQSSKGKKKEIGKKSGSYWVWSAINRWLFTWLEQNIQVEIDSRSSVAQLYFVYFLHNGLVFPESLREAASFHRQGTVLLPLPMEILNDTHLGTVRGCVRVAFLSHVQSCLSYQTHMGCVPSYSSLTFFHGKVIT